MSKFMVGVDFGTTNTSITYMLYNNFEDKFYSECFKFKGNDYIKSLITYKDNENYWVGDDALQYKIKYPNRFVKSIKRKLIENEKLNINSLNKNQGNIIADILKYLKNQITKQLPLDTDIEGVIMGVPIGFSDNLKEVYLNALVESGFYSNYEDGKKKSIFVSEPIAAVLDYNLSLKDDKKVLVFDFGGGTLDIVAMQMNNIRQNNELNEHDVLAKGGQLKLGGDDFDKRILEDIIADKVGIRNLKRSLGIVSFDEIDSVYAGIELMRKIQIAKEELSSYNMANVSLKVDDLNLDVDITREEFELAIKPYMKQIKNSILECLSSANNGVGLRANDIDVVVLVGGTSFIPIIQDTVGEIFGENKVKIHKDAMTCIARGLALRGHNYDSTKYSDILEHSYGIEMLDEMGEYPVVCNILKKDGKIKEINTVKFYKEFELNKSSKNKNHFSVTICEDNKTIGKARIPFKKELMRDSKFKLYFVIDEKLNRLELKIYDTNRNQLIEIPLEEKYININKLED